MNAQQWPANTAANLVEVPGVTAPPDGPRHKFLSDAMVAEGLVSVGQMQAALEAARTGGRYSEILVDSGVISEDDLARITAAHYRMDHVDLDVYPVDPDVVSLVSRGTARRLGAVPVAVLETGEVVLALHDPEALTNTVEVAELLGREIRAVVAARSQIERLIERPGSQPSEPPPPTRADRPSGLIPATPVLRAVDPDPAPVVEPDPPVYIGPPQPETVQLRDELERRLEEAVARAEAAEQRAADAERKVTELERRLADSERHAAGMMASAQAANEALAQLAKASVAPPPVVSMAPPPVVVAPAAPVTLKARGLRRMIAALRQR